MQIEEIEKKLSKLTEDINEEEFIYDLLLAYEQPKAAITRLKKGDYNQSNKDNEVLWKKKLYFHRVKDGDPHFIIDELTKDSLAQKQSPRFIIVTNFQLFLAKDTKTKGTLDIDINKLSKHTDFFLPWTGQEKSQIENENPADIKAAERMGMLYDIIINDNPEPTKNESSRHFLNIFFSRLLFCSFAEDAGIFEQNQFTKSIDSHTKKDGSDLTEYLENLFKVLNQEKRSDLPQYLDSFPYVNGSLFADEYPIPDLSQKARKMIIESGELDWASINPDILGSMMQAVVHHTDRAEIGMHYTSVTNIMKVIKPLFLDDLYEELEQAEENERKLEKLLGRIYKMKIFDPACGSGNFLVISYKELCRLEIEIFKKLQELNPNKWGIATSGIRLNQFYGIELDDFAHETAKVSLWLAQHQVNLLFEGVFGQIKPSLPLKESGKIVCANSLRVDWKEVCSIEEKSEVFIISNPPFLGSRNQKENQKDDMKYLFVDKYKSLDYVCCWFLKAANYIRNENAFFSFVSTNSISQGEQVGLFWPRVLKEDLEIHYAHNSFKWKNYARHNAGVIVVVVGVRNKSNKPKHLFKENTSKLVKDINGYLTETSSVYIYRRSKSLVSNIPKMVYGSLINDRGNLVLSSGERENLLREYPNAKAFLKRFIGSREFIRGEERWCLFISDKKLKEAKSIPEINKRLKAVSDHRLTSTEKSTVALASLPHKYYFSAHQEGTSIIIPRTSSERRDYIPIGLLGSDSIISDAAQAIYNPPNYLFAILTSNLHMVWVRAIAGRLKTDYRYSSALCYNNFPFIKLDEKQETLLEESVFKIIDEREKFPERTMAQLYDPDSMPKGLKESHKENDILVDELYQIGSMHSDEKRLECLLNEYNLILSKNNA